MSAQRQQAPALLNLLARIHRDGGHYTEEHGAEKSAADAEAIVVSLMKSAELPQVPVSAEAIAVIGRDFSLLWASPDSIATIRQRTGLKVGDALYLAQSRAQVVPAAPHLHDELSRDNDGDIALDWEAPDGSVLSMSVSPNGGGVYAWRLVDGRADSGVFVLPVEAYGILSDCLDAAESAEAAQVVPTEPVAWKDHQIRDLVDAVTAAAKTYGSTQQARARIREALEPAISAIAAPAVSPQVVPAEPVVSIDAAIQWVEDRRDNFIGEHGYSDPDTGAIEYGRGAHAQAKEEYVGELEEIIEGLRELKDDAAPAVSEPAEPRKTLDELMMPNRLDETADEFSERLSVAMMLASPAAAPSAPIEPTPPASRVTPHAMDDAFYRHISPATSSEESDNYQAWFQLGWMEAQIAAAPAEPTPEAITDERIDAMLQALENLLYDYSGANMLRDDFTAKRRAIVRAAIGGKTC